MIARLLVGLVKLLVGAQGRWLGVPPTGERQRIYFANHSSHLDALALWAALPPALRRRTRPVAAQDYWALGGLRQMVAVRGFNAVFVARQRERPDQDLLAPLAQALAAGDSLILFPEGTRSAEALPLPFKSGLYRLARQFPQVELVAVYLDTLHRSLPKGSLLPVPLVCTVRFGRGLQLHADEDKDAFLERAHAAVTELA
ncbi:MAG: 1-acyl-sn-glycerol-3-phosphate acyltransferase [Xanthomonadales bacterium]|nr:1-acyl-sn-glycerol-3-phosphate acyltransferase [Xanthomonadales bacterium]